MNKSRPLLLFLLLVAFGLRVYRLDGQSLWWDEGISLHLATSTWVEIVADRAGNIHPPLYFFLLKGWVSLVGLSPFAVRYASVLASWGQVAAVYALCRRWFNQQTAVLATLLLATSPLAIIYAQETRVYALLPLIYIPLLGVTQRLTQPQPALRHWLCWAGLAWFGLHLHYITAFALVYLSLWLLAVYGRQRRWHDARRWLWSQLGVAAASLPWLLVVWQNRTAVVAEANAGTYLTDPVPLPFLAAQVWTFHLTGLPGSVSRPLVQLLTAVVALSLLGLLLTTRQRGPWLLRHWLLPVILAFLAWSVRSFAHPRYVTMFAVALMPLCAYLLHGQPGGKRPFSRLLASLLLLAIISLATLSLWRYYFDPAVAKDNMRAVARHLEATATPDDLILVPDTDWSLPFEYGGTTPITMPHAANPSQMWALLKQRTQAAPHVYWVDYKQGANDWQNAVPYALEAAGTLLHTAAFDNLLLHTYQLQRPIQRPELLPMQAQFGSLQLTAVSQQSPPPADTALTLALQWQLTQPTADRLHAALRLTDQDGWQLARAETMLLDPSGRPTDQWPLHTPITTYHLVPLPPGTPPLTYPLSLSLYSQNESGVQTLELLDEQGAPQGQQLALPTVTLAPSLGVDNPYGVATEPLQPLEPALTLATGLQLTGASPLPATVGAGRSLIVQLQWQATAPLADLRPALQLVQGETVLAQVAEPPALGRYATDRWRVGETVGEHRSLRPPPTAVGAATVQLVLDDLVYRLGEVEIVAEERLFARPLISQSLDVVFGDVARLVGYDLPRQQLRANESVPLTLYWQALGAETTTSYVVFTHVLAENGRLVGQHDGVPANGRLPIPSWLPTEYIIDPHDMQFREPYVGEGTIEIGLYDPATGSRIPTSSGADHYLLPLTLTVQP